MKSEQAVNIIEHSENSGETLSVKVPVWMKAFSRENSWDQMNSEQKQQLLDRLTMLLQTEKSVTLLFNGEPVKIYVDNNGRLKFQHLDSTFGF